MSLELLNDPSVAGGLKPTFASVTASTVGTADLLSVTAGDRSAGGDVAVEIKSVDASASTEDRTWAIGLADGQPARLAFWGYDDTGAFITDRLSINRISRGVYVGQTPTNRGPIAASNVGHACVYYTRAFGTTPAVSVQLSAMIMPGTGVGAALPNLADTLPPNFTDVATGDILGIVVPPLGFFRVTNSIGQTLGTAVVNATDKPIKAPWQAAWGPLDLDSLNKYELTSSF